MGSLAWIDGAGIMEQQIDGDDLRWRGGGWRGTDEVAVDGEGEWGEVGGSKWGGTEHTKTRGCM